MRNKPVCVHRWPNGAEFSTRVFKRSKVDEPSDVIELTIKPAKGRGNKSMWMLNVEDATAIIHALSTAMTFAIEQRSPVAPNA